MVGHQLGADYVPNVFVDMRPNSQSEQFIVIVELHLEPTPRSTR